MKQPHFGKQGQDNTASRFQYWAMIAWIALTFFFTTVALFGLVMLAAGENPVPYEKISSSTLLIIAAGAILLIEALTRFIDSPEEDAPNAPNRAPGRSSGQSPVPEKPRLDMKSLLLYVVLVVIIVVGGIWLNHSLPVFTVSPPVSLVIAAIGWIGLKPLFLRKKR